MKKTLMLLPLLAVLLLAQSVLGASEPTLVNSFSIDGGYMFTSSGNDYYQTDLPLHYDQYPEEEIFYNVTGTYIKSDYNFAVWDNYVATQSMGQGICKMEIWDWTTGNRMYGTDIPQGCNYGYLLYTDTGLLIVGLDLPNSQTTINPSHAVYDVSNIGFVEQLNITTFVAGVGGNPFFSIATTWREKYVVSATSDSVEWINGGYKFKLSGNNNLSYEGQIDEVTISPQHYAIDLFDKENGVFVSDDYRTSAFSQDFVAGYKNFYRIDGDARDFNSYDDKTLIGTVENNVGVIADWNNNFLNPEYVTTEGHIMLVGGSDYDNFQTSSLNLNFTPKFFFERDNIIGVENNRWVYGDASNISGFTKDVGNNPINADFMLRFDDNKILTYNRTNYEFKIYEVPQPSFIDEAETGVNTPPSKTLDLLGIDNNGRFIFTAEFTDAEGGLVFQALTTENIVQTISEGTYRDTVNFQTAPSQIVVNSAECEGVTDYVNSERRGYQAWLDTFTEIDSHDEDFFCSLKHEHTKVDSEQSETLRIGGTLAIDSGGLILETESSSISISDGNYNYIVNIGLDVEHYTGSPSNVSVYALGVQGDIVTEEPVNGGQDTFYFYDFTIDFSTQKVNFSLWEYEDYTQDLGLHYIVEDYELDFYQEAYAVENIYFNLFGSKNLLKVGGTSLTYEYQNVTSELPDYEVVGTLEPSETAVELLRSEGNHDFGFQRALLYATDSELGSTYYENPFILTFDYDETIQQLSEEQIQEAYSNALSSANDGFSIVDTIEGDLVTDTLFGYLDRWNIKSTASKFMIGLFLILALIGVGGYIGTIARSNVASGIGAFSGGIGGLFLVTYWGLFPLWVTFIVSLLTIAVISNIVRNGVTGNGGG